MNDIQQEIVTVVMCSSVISSRTPHLISTTCEGGIGSKHKEKRKKEYLVLKPMFLPAVLLDLGVDVLHQRVPLHQHVGEGGACKDAHHLAKKKMAKKHKIHL